MATQKPVKHTQKQLFWNFVGVLKFENTFWKFECWTWEIWPCAGYHFLPALFNILVTLIKKKWHFCRFSQKKLAPPRWCLFVILSSQEGYRLSDRFKICSIYLCMDHSLNFFFLPYKLVLYISLWGGILVLLPCWVWRAASRREKSEREEREGRNVLVSWWTYFFLSMVFLLWLWVGILWFREFPWVSALQTCLGSRP